MDLMAMSPQPDVPVLVETGVRQFFPMASALSGHKTLYRTDQHYHAAVGTDGTKVDVSYNHV